MDFLLLFQYRWNSFYNIYISYNIKNYVYHIFTRQRQNTFLSILLSF